MLHGNHMKMIEKFNELMKGFISENITIEWLRENPEGTLRNGSSECRYKLKNSKGGMLLGAYGVSRFTNWRYHEITEDGNINYEWFCQEGCIAGDPNSENNMRNHNQEGFDRIESFGINKA